MNAIGYIFVASFYPQGTCLPLNPPSGLISLPSIINETMNRLIILFLLEAQLLSNYIDATDSPRHSHGMFSSFRQISVVVDRFGRSLRFCHLEFDEEAIYDTFPCSKGEFCILSDIRELRRFFMRILGYVR